VHKIASRDDAAVGDTIVFSIGLSNGLARAADAAVGDTLPDELALGEIWHTCPSGEITVSGNRFDAVGLSVPAGRACQIVFSAVVVEGCDCTVVNVAGWLAVWETGGASGEARSQPIFLEGHGDPGYRRPIKAWR
jgi:uncharacterized repeat protein (TIGR01451 family)